MKAVSITAVNQLPQTFTVHQIFDGQYKNMVFNLADEGEVCYILQDNGILIILPDQTIYAQSTDIFIKEFTKTYGNDQLLVKSPASKRITVMFQNPI